VRVPLHEGDRDVDAERYHGEDTRPVNKRSGKVLNETIAETARRTIRISGYFVSRRRGPGRSDDAAPEPEPAHHPADVAMHLAEVIERVDRAPAHEAESRVAWGARLSNRCSRR